MKLSIAVLALISTSQAHVRLSRRSYLGVRFVEGMGDVEIENDGVEASQFAEFNSVNPGISHPGVRFINQGVRFVQGKSDPISGSLGWPKIDMKDLSPE